MMMRRTTPWTALILACLPLGAAAQAPTFGSPYRQQQFEIESADGSVHRLVTLTKRADGDYDMRSVDVKGNSHMNGVLRSEGGNRFSGDIFDTGSGLFRHVMIRERDTGESEIEIADYGADTRISGVIRCHEGQCRYHRK